MNIKLNKINLIFKPYASIFFINNLFISYIIFTCSLLVPNIGIGGIISLLSTILFAEIIGLREEYLNNEFYLYNSLLVGMGIGYYFKLSFEVILLIMMASILTFLLSFSLKNIFAKYFLPILSLPFTFTSILIYLATLKYHNLPGVNHVKQLRVLFDFNVPFDYFFKSIGNIIFLPINVVGVILFLIILIYSRIIAFLVIIGFIFGVLFHSLFIPLEKSLYSPYNFNFILISVAIGGIFLIPNFKNYMLSIIGVFISVIVIDAMEVLFTLYNTPLYTLPFNLIVLLFLLMLYNINYRYNNKTLYLKPEKALEYYLSNIYRFGDNDIKINLPFTGKWTVYQEFDDEWTHKGEYKYAYDFVIKREGKTYQNEGKFLEDYYAFGQSIISPINGYVVDLKNDLSDNFIGSVDRINNWGNYIIIKSIDGSFYVEISHLMKNSITVKIGDYVEIGQIIGKCGNSGYSPEPHIHIQVQYLPYLGSYTVPFKFIDYIKNDEIYYFSLPKKGEEIEGTIIDKNLFYNLTFILDDEFKYNVIDNDNNVIDRYIIKVKMNNEGEFYFTDEHNNKLFFYTTNKFFYFYKYEGDNYSYLKEIFRIIPRIPFINKNIKFKDYLFIWLLEMNDNNILYSKIKLLIKEFLLPFNYKIFQKPVIYTKENLKITSKYGYCKMNFYKKGFNEIKLYNGKKLVLI